MFGIEIWENNPCVTPKGVATLECIPFVFQNVIAALLGIIGFVSLVVIIVSGMKFMTARGDAKHLEAAKLSATYAVAGLIVVLFSFLIINLIGDLTGTSRCLEFFQFTNCE